MDSSVETVAAPLYVTIPAPRGTWASTSEQVRPCRCGHGRDAHEHFRAGTDCAACDCARFRRSGRRTGR